MAENTLRDVLILGLFGIAAGGLVYYLWIRKPPVEPPVPPVDEVSAKISEFVITA